MLALIREVVVKRQDREGEGCLLEKAYHGDLEGIDFLLRNQGVDVNQVDIMGITPLMMAAQQGHKRAVILLLQDGKVNVNQAMPSGVSALILAAAWGYDDVVSILANQARLNINQQDQMGRTALWMAAYRGHNEVLRVLMSHGADENMADKRKMTPLDIAICRKNHIIEKTLRLANAQSGQKRQDSWKNDGQEDAVGCAKVDIDDEKVHGLKIKFINCNQQSIPVRGDMVQMSQDGFFSQVKEDVRIGRFFQFLAMICLLRAMTRHKSRISGKS